MTVQSIVCVQYCTNELSAQGKADITTNTLSKSLYNNLHPLIKNDSPLFLEFNTILTNGCYQ